MGDPELRNDETVLVRTQAVYVKSIPFEGILTNKRIILVDRAKNLLPPKEIPLITIKEVEPGENAIRDQILTLSVMAKTGETRQMILTFSRQAGGNRIKERDEWARIIRENTATSFEQVIRKVIPGSVQPPRKLEPPAQPPRAAAPASPVQPAAPAERITPAKEPSAVPPLRRIIETPPVAPPQAPPAARQPAPPVQNQFCSQCGNKVPVNSAFCNRCGAAITAPSAPVPAPVPASVPVAAPVPVETPAPAPVSGASALQQAAEAFSRTTRPIDQEIQEIEPLIERSTARIPPDPLRSTAPEIQVPRFSMEDEPAPAPATPPAGKQAAKGFISKLLPQKTSASPQPKPEPAFGGFSSPPPKPPKGSGLLGGKKKNVIIALIAMIIIIVAAVVIFPMVATKGEEPTPSSTPTPPVTTVPIHIGTIVIPVTTSASIPATGVYVHVVYLGGFKGSYGMPPDAMTIVPGNSGERVWEVELANGTVNATFEKLDGSTHELLVEIFKNGVPLTSANTTIGHGSVALSVNVTSGEAAPPVTSGAAPLSTAAPAATTAAVTTNTTAAAAATTVQTTTAAVTNTTTTVTTAAVNATATTP